MTAREAAKAAGVTLRCLQWWVKTGLVTRSGGMPAVRQARIWGMIARRFGSLRKSLTHSVGLRRCVWSATIYSPRFIALYGGWRSNETVGAKCLKDERAVLKFGAYIRGSMVLIEIPEKERA